ncbi:MAG: response regulator [Bacteroidota bacterium]|nr:response regulator [Bacteroidota bacterium]
MDKIHKIFVIEDNRTENLLFKLALSSIENVEIKTFLTGTDLLHSLNEKPHIVIVDVMLPDIQGYDLIKAIKEYNQKINVIVLSGQTDVELIGKIQSLGIYNYIVKSEECLKYLEDVIKNLLIIINHKEKTENI